jgi:hypothetical protein
MNKGYTGLVVLTALGAGIVQQDITEWPFQDDMVEVRGNCELIIIGTIAELTHSILVGSEGPINEKATHPSPETVE